MRPTRAYSHPPNLLAVPYPGLAAFTVRAIHSDPLLVLPGDTVRISVGNGAAAATTATTDIGGECLIASIVATFIPLGKTKSYYETFTGLAKDFAGAYADYRNCLSRGELDRPDRV